jgi:PAS domain S-box-containing protein
MTFPLWRWRSPQEVNRAQPRLLKMPLPLMLTVPFVVLTLGTTGLVGYCLWQTGQQAIEALAQQWMAETGDRVHLYLNNYLKTPHLINRLNARAIQLGQLNTTQPQVLQQTFLQQVQEFGVLRLHFSNPNGGLVGAGNDERGFTVSSTEGFRRGQLQIYTVDRQGQRQQKIVDLPNYDARQRPFYQKAVVVGQPTWTPIYAYVPTISGLGIAASYPVYNADRQLQGVLSADLTLSALTQFLQSMRVGKHGQVFIMERSGWLVATSTAEPPTLPGAKDQPGQRIRATASQNLLIRLAAQSLQSRSSDFSQRSIAHPLRVTLNRKPHFIGVTPYQDSMGLDWVIVTVVPMADFLDSANARLYPAVWLSAGALIAAIGLGGWLTRAITRPIQRLAQVSSLLAKGEWEQVTEPTTSAIAEVQVLNQSFSQMAAQLQQSFDRVQTALGESEEKFAKVFRTCPDAIDITTLEGQLVEANEAFFEQLGYSRESTMTRTETPIYDWVNPDDRQRYVQQLLAGNPVRGWELEVRHKTGKLLTVLFSADLIDLQGQPHVMGVTTNISDRKRAELELQHQKELQEVIYNESTDALFLVDPNTLLITDCNRRAVELFEADRKETLIGIEGRTLQHRAFTEAEIDAIVTEMREKGYWSQEIEYVTRKGNLFWGNLAVKPIQLVGQAIHLMRVTDTTDRKQAELALRQNEARFEQLSAASPSIIFSIEESPGQPVLFDYLSPAFEEIYEIPVAAALDDATIAFEMIHPDDRDGHQQAVSRSAETMQPFQHEWRIITPSGKTKWVQATSRPERRQDGVLVWHGVMLDITDHKQAEAALRESEITKNQILKAMPDLIFWMSVDGICLDRVESDEVLHLYPGSETIGSNLYALLPADLAELRRQAVNQALATGDVQVYEQRIMLHGGFYYEEVRVVGVGDDRVLVIIRNITSRKQAEIALQESEERFRSAFQDAPIGMALIGLDDRWLKVNPVLCQMFEYSEAELLMNRMFAMVHPEDRSTLQQYIELSQSQANHAPHVELRYQRKGGLIIWVRLSLSAVRDAHQQAACYVVQIQDITQEHAVNRMKDEFISIVSHELRTPLTAIQGFLGLLKTGIYANNPEKTQRMLTLAMDNGDRLVRLVNDILDLERLSSGKVQLVMMVCDAGELMQRAVDSIHSIADQAAVTLTILPTDAQIWAAPDAILQTLTNLLSNAIKFSPPQSTVTLSAQTQIDTVLFQVRDRGRGIPADKLESVFGRFQQVDVSDSRQKGGTGLGLAICQSIVQQHGGNIWVESTLGEGSAFYFTLPTPDH